MTPFVVVPRGPRRWRPSATESFRGLHPPLEELRLNSVSISTVAAPSENETLDCSRLESRICFYRSHLSSGPERSLSHKAVLGQLLLIGGGVREYPKIDLGAAQTRASAPICDCAINLPIFEGVGKGTQRRSPCPPTPVRSINATCSC